MPIEETDVERVKRDRVQKTSTKKMVLDALFKECLAESSIGSPNSPTLPLVGSLNVPITRTEEKEETDE